MPFPNVAISREDFDRCRWEDVIAQSDERTCQRYSTLFFAKARDAETGEDKKAQGVFAVLGGITSLHLKPEARQEPFGPMFVFSDGRSAILDDFTDNHLDALAEVAPHAADPEIRARIADVLWVRRRDHRMAKLAVGSYLKTASNLEDPEHWTQCEKRIERAVNLAALLGRRKEEFDKVISHVESVLDRYKGEDPLFLSARMMEILLEHRRGDASKYSRLSDKLAVRAEAEGDWRRARTYWNIKARWHASDKDADNERAALIRAAETYVEDAQAALKRESGGYLAASAHLQSAITALGRISGTQERVEDLHRTLLDYQEKSLAEMQSFSADVDLTEQVERSLERVRGKTLEEALFSLALMGRSPQVDKLREQVEEEAKQYPLQHLFQSLSLGEKGRVTGRKPSVLSNDPEEVEAATRAEMFNKAQFYQSVHAQALIEPVRNLIAFEHDVRVQDLLTIVSNSPFVPGGREYIYAQGLHAGLHGDFLVAAHLLVPQLEASVRYLLTQQGTITSKLDSEALQEERSLNKTLYLPQMQEILGVDIVFDLQGLLVDRFGSNLRNRIAHGLMNQSAFFTWQVSYLWWLTLRLCCLPMIAQLHTREQPETDEEQVSDS